MTYLSHQAHHDMGEHLARVKAYRDRYGVAN
jgi:hypothetical protein